MAVTDARPRTAKCPRILTRTTSFNEVFQTLYIRVRKSLRCHGSRRTFWPEPFSIGRRKKTVKKQIQSKLWSLTAWSENKLVSNVYENLRKILLDTIPKIYFKFGLSGNSYNLQTLLYNNVYKCLCLLLRVSLNGYHFSIPQLIFYCYMAGFKSSLYGLRDVLYELLVQVVL